MAGIVSATFYAVLPAWMQANEVSQANISLFMLSAVLGGLAFQVPVGRLSDQFDRRALLGALAIGFALAAILLVNVPRTLAIIVPVTAVLGGFMSTLYPVCVSNAMDNMSGERVVSISSRLILVSGIGSTIGPFTGSWIMRRLDIDGVLYFMAAVAAVLGVAAFARTFMKPDAVHEDRPFVVVRRRQ
ncbi:MFS transporter [Starkeya sp. ORNL1]|uniref:MFS transporter n=1 Tax=Starkeya sp. ORNL1 TaxID=2709380 RepID=UPI00197FAD31|nr:MFS transporter [Starkeya sp. ORNL1]